MFSLSRCYYDGEDKGKGGSGKSVSYDQNSILSASHTSCSYSISASQNGNMKPLIHLADELKDVAIFARVNIHVLEY